MPRSGRVLARPEHLVQAHPRPDPQYLGHGRSRVSACAGAGTAAGLKSLTVVNESRLVTAGNPARHASVLRHGGAHLREQLAGCGRPGGNAGIIRPMDGSVGRMSEMCRRSLLPRRAGHHDATNSRNILRPAPNAMQALAVPRTCSATAPRRMRASQVLSQPDASVRNQTCNSEVSSSSAR